MADGRQHHAGRGCEALDVATDLVDVLVAARNPEAAPGFRVEHGALIPQLGIGRGAAGPHRVVVVVERRRALIGGRHERTTATSTAGTPGSIASVSRRCRSAVRTISFARAKLSRTSGTGWPCRRGIARGIAADLAVRVRP